MKGRLLMVLLVVSLMMAGLTYGKITYEDGNVVIRDGSYTIQKIDNPDYMEIKGDVCYLKKPVKVKSDATFKVTDCSCDEVRMYPESWIESWGTLYFDKVKVISHDPETGKPIELSRDDHTTMRPDIVTRSSARYFSAKDSEFAYLGYYNDTSSHWGVALRFLPKAYVYNCSFHDNYFGFYTFDSDNVRVKNSRIHDNLEYGLNFHDFSDNLGVKYNEVYNNGNHGLILSKYCEDGSLILNKVSNHTRNAFVKGEVRDYGTHGIMLHLQSNNNLLSRNEVTNNREGIKFFDSHNNLVKTNRVYSDLEEGFVVDHSNSNVFKYNRFYDSDEENVYLLNSFNNYWADSKWYDENIAYVKIEHDNGEVERHKIPTDEETDHELNLLGSVASVANVVSDVTPNKGKGTNIASRIFSDIDGFEPGLKKAETKMERRKMVDQIKENERAQEARAQEARAQEARAHEARAKEAIAKEARAQEARAKENKKDSDKNGNDRGR